jgi:hypothetical protein
LPERLLIRFEAAAQDRSHARRVASSDRLRRSQPVYLLPNTPFRQSFEATVRLAGSDYRANTVLPEPGSIIAISYSTPLWTIDGSYATGI